MITRVRIPTCEGTFVAAFSLRGLRQIEFPGPGDQDPVDVPPDVLLPGQQRWLNQTRAALEAALAGRNPPPSPPLDWSGHTGFRQRVWLAMLEIPLGRTASYGDIAGALGQPSASRAVGGACGANPVPVLVPCHRVLAAGGRIGGFSGGLDWKRRLLAIEGILAKEKAPEETPALL